MPFFRLRTVPRLSQEVKTRATPNNMLMKHLLSEKANITFPLNKQFTEQIVTNTHTTTNTSGFEYPIGGTEALPFHVDRTNVGSLPVYIDYR
jgi:hypothetical protein